jgi:hypothetical protein
VVQLVNVTWSSVTGDTDVLSPYDKYIAPPSPLVDEHVSNNDGNPDVPVNVNCVDGPGTTIDTHPPFDVAYVFRNVLLVSVKVDSLDVAAVPTMLTAPPVLPEWPSTNVDSVMVVVMPSYESASKLNDPPLEVPAVDRQLLKSLDVISTVDVANASWYKKLMAPPLLVLMMLVNCDASTVMSQDVAVPV